MRCKKAHATLIDLVCYSDIADDYSYIVPGFIVNSFVAALIAAVVLGLVNLPIKVLLTLPPQ